MSIPAISAQAQATASQVLQYQNTQDNKLSEGIEILTVIRKTSEANQEHNPCVLFFHDSQTARKVSVANGNATIENCYHSDIKLLGEGCFGTVSKGLLQHKNGLQIEVAVKTIFSEYYDDKDFYNEVKALQTLENQDHVVQFYFALHDTSSFNCHIVMELGDIDLEEYLEFIRQHPELNINEQQLAKMGWGIYSGTLACILNNIFNIDIKPKNFLIFLGSDTIKIADFGILSYEKHLDDEILDTMIVQTASTFTQCALLNKANFDNQEIQNKLQTIALDFAHDFPSDADKEYFKKMIASYVNDNPLLLKLIQGVFGYNGKLSDIKKTLTKVKNVVGFQALTDIRPML
jgi:serine/threonine protein kinase